MSHLSRSVFACGLFVLTLAFVSRQELYAAEAAEQEHGNVPSVKTSNPPTYSTLYRPMPPSTHPIADNHPLAGVMQYARREQLYLQQELRDFTCQLVKRERIGGILQDYCYIDMSVREELREDDAVVQPMSIFLNFVGPTRVAGRKVLFIDGQNDGRMLVRNGGKHFDYVIVRVDPLGESAMKESLVPITQTGFNRMLGQFINVLQRHAQADPEGQNTQVQRIEGAKVNERLCTAIRIVHPRKQAGLEFHVANVLIDDELRVPVHVDFSEWPHRADQPGPLLAEYTYTDLKINVHLTDSTFNRNQLLRRSKSGE